MARRVSLPATLALSAAAVIGLVACTGPTTPKAAAGLTSRKVTVANIDIAITPTQFDTTGASFRITFDTHTGAPGIDVAAHSTLTVAGTAWPGAAWSGDGPGGHHRTGTLRFTSAGPARGLARLDITGLSGPLDATWQLPS